MPLINESWCIYDLEGKDIISGYSSEASATASACLHNDQNEDAHWVEAHCEEYKITELPSQRLTSYERSIGIVIPNSRDTLSLDYPPNGFLPHDNTPHSYPFSDPNISWAGYDYRPPIPPS